MMKWVFTGLIVIAIISGAFSGNMNAVSNAAISSCGEAVTLALKLMGSMCLWNGLMEVARKSGLTDIISRLLRPVTGFLFRGLPSNSPALPLISMNLTANLLGLGNAATPLGIAAMKELSAQQLPHLRDTTSVHMSMLVVLNCASVQLLPTTIALLRLEYGASNPLDVLPSILIASFTGLAAGVLMVHLCSLPERRAERQGNQWNQTEGASEW